MARLGLALSMVLALCGCRQPPETKPADATRWSCGTAAGVCTCIPVHTDVGALARACAAADCCFLGLDGSCSCRMSSAALGCDALMTALGGRRRVASCPR